MKLKVGVFFQKIKKKPDILSQTKGKKRRENSNNWNQKWKERHFNWRHRTNKDYNRLPTSVHQQVG